jgi:putative ABC transport system substrate-binding protein
MNFRLPILDFRLRRSMSKIFSIRVLGSHSDNRKPVLSEAEGSKTCAELRRSSQNLRWRRIFAIGFAFSIYGAVAHSQTAKVVRIGFLGPNSAASTSSRMESLRAGLRDLGYVEGKNLVIESRWADGNYDRLPDLATELVGLKVDLILTSGTPGTRAARSATTTIPIIMVTSGDPVAVGLVASLARPGGNITGSSNFAPELSAKRVELIKEAFPATQRVGVIFNPDNSINDRNLSAMEQTSKALKLGLQKFGVRSADDFKNAYSAMAKRRVDAVALPEDDFLSATNDQVVDLVSKQRLPSIGRAEFAEAGGIIGYAVNFFDLYRRAAVFVDKIVKGANPGDLPVEQPRKFDFIVNLKAAKQIGLTIPPNVLVRADKVIK